MPFVSQKHSKVKFTFSAATLRRPVSFPRNLWNPFGSICDPGQRSQMAASPLGRGILGGSVGKESACKAGDTGDVSSTRVRKIPWRRKWQPSPAFLPEKSHGQRSLAGDSPRGHKESGMTERASACTCMHHICRQPMWIFDQQWFNGFKIKAFHINTGVSGFPWNTWRLAILAPYSHMETLGCT